MQPPLKLYDINKSNLEENKVKIVGFVKKISYIHTRSIYKTIRVAHIDYYDYKSCKIKNETVLLTEYEKSNGVLREGSLVYILAIECRNKIKFQYLLNEYCSTPWKHDVFGVNEKNDKFELSSYKKIQQVAKKTIEYIKNIIKPGMNLCEIRKLCEEKMLELGADSFWYWDVGAFVFSGDETTVSVSGKQYVTSDRVIEENDIITIDLSPQAGNIWGDYARTIVVENGKVVDNIDSIQKPEWKSGLQMEEKLHAELFSFVTKETTFEELYYHMNKFIMENGFVNLDFMGNLGHSIVKAKDDRIYIEKGNTMKLSYVNYFTFEPHIAFQDSKYGYKKENIYYFEGNKLVELAQS